MITQGKEINPVSKKELAGACTSRAIQDSVLSYKIGSKTVTKPNGDRHLVNEGTAGGTASMHTGQGVNFDGTQKVRDAFLPFLDKDFTLIFGKAKHNSRHGRYWPIDNTRRFYFGHDSNGVIVGFGGSFAVLPTSNPQQTLEQVMCRFDNTTRLVDISIQGQDIEGQINVGVDNNLTELVDIGSYNGLTTQAMTGVQTALYYIPERLTDRQKEMYYQQPELLLCKKYGRLKSAILKQATLDLMESGVGCWYPMTEGQGVFIKNHALLDNSLNLLVNGDFSDGTNSWNTSSWWVEQNGAIHMPSTDQYKLLSQALSIPANSVVEFEVLNISGVAKVAFDGDQVTTFNTVGIKRVTTGAASGRIDFSRQVGSLCELTIDNVKVYPISQTVLKPITNAGNSDIWGNGYSLGTGLQTSLLERDSIGVITGLADNLQFNGDSVVNFDTPLILTGSWCLDIFADTLGETSTSNICVLEGSSLGNTDLLLYKGVNDTKLRLRVHNKYIAMIGSVPTRGVFSVECVDGVLSAYANGVLQGVGAGVETQTTILNIGQRYAITDQGFKGESGELLVTRTSRTAVERDTAVNKLIRKHGVII